MTRMANKYTPKKRSKVRVDDYFGPWVRTRATPSSRATGAAPSPWRYGLVFDWTDPGPFEVDFGNHSEYHAERDLHLVTKENFTKATAH